MQFWPLALLVEPPNDDLAFGGLAYMLGGLLHRVREQREACCALDSLDWTTCQ